MTIFLVESGKVRILDYVLDSSNFGNKIHRILVGLNKPQLYQIEDLDKVKISVVEVDVPKSSANARIAKATVDCIAWNRVTHIQNQALKKWYGETGISADAAVRLYETWPDKKQIDSMFEDILMSGFKTKDLMNKYTAPQYAVELVKNMLPHLYNYLYNK